MKLFETSKARERREREARQAQQQADVHTEKERKAAIKRAREDAWRKCRNEVIGRLHAAERAHAAIKKEYDRYAPGDRKTALGVKLNEAADAYSKIDREFQGVNQFSAWDKTH